MPARSELGKFFGAAVPEWVSGELAVIRQFSLVQLHGTHQQEWTRWPLLAFIVRRTDDWDADDESQPSWPTYVVHANNCIYRVQGHRLATPDQADLYAPLVPTS